ncbi:MAG: FG-GAP-like repeat-containing protein [Acidobacteriaceae bacterium]
MSPVATSPRLFASRVLPFLLAHLGLFALLLLAPAQSAAAATDTFSVQVTSDDFSGSFSNLSGTAANCPANAPASSANCSLRDAITAANADANPVIVDLSALSGTITLANPLPGVFPNTANTITFAGPGATTLTVSGANAYQVFQILKGTAAFHDFTVANGSVVPIPNGGTFGPNNGCSCDPGFGGGIYAFTNVSLTLTNMVLNSNHSGYDGGAVLAIGPLVVTNTTFSNNFVDPGSYAAGLYALGTPATVSGSSFYNNSAYVGSAIYVSNYLAGMTLTISDSTFVNNSSLSGGTGAIFNASGATLNIHDSTFWNNIAGIGEGGAFYNAGTMTVTDSVVGAPGTPTALQMCYSSGSCPATGDGNGNVVGGDTLDLSPLGNYGGPTETMPPATGSPVICAGKSGTPYAETVSGTALTTDERGMPLDSSCSAGETDAGAVQGSNLCKTGNTNPNPNPAMFAATQDFNGDCKSDVLWRNSSTQQVYEWLMNGTTFTSGSTGSPTSDWVIQGSGDFNGDGKSDILWRNSTTGQVYIWLMNGSTQTSNGSLGYVSPDWTIAGIGDFTGNGKSDILWWNSSTGQIYLWYINGTTMSGGASVSYISGGWTIAGIGDFNGDGKADILWRNSSTGQLYVWLMNGSTLTSSGGMGSVSSDWVIAGVGDFNGEGKSDILWRNSTTGQVYLWFMNGASLASGGSVSYVSPVWNIEGVGDYDGSGRAGILWRNSSTQQVYIWLMNGTTVGSTGTPGTPDATWQIAP